jgi:GxxExxY protein
MPPRNKPAWPNEGNTEAEIEQKETKVTKGVACSLAYLAADYGSLYSAWMHPQYSQADALSGQVIGAAIEVHRLLGPGLLESIYEKCLLHELELRQIPAISQEKVRIDYKGKQFEETLRFDVLVAGCLLIEVKAVEAVLPVHKAAALSYMKLLNAPIGLVINFHEAKLVDGISRLYLKGANLPD